jgi:ferritin-like metal-binding protein YciE
MCKKLYRKQLLERNTATCAGTIFYCINPHLITKIISIMPRNTKSSIAGKTASKGSSKSEETMLKELFVDELKDIYWAEKHLTKALPKMKKACTSEELANAFDEHLAVTQQQIGRLEEVFEMLDMAARAKKCDAMEGLVKEAEAIIEELPKGSMVRDAGLIIAGQKVEHYEIAAYGSLVQLAKTMGENEIADLLQETLDEEKEADQLLTELAVSGINIGAEGETED